MPEFHERIEETSLDDAPSKAARALDEMLAGQRLGIVIRGVLPPEAAHAVVAAAEAERFQSYSPEYYAGTNYGPTLVVSDHSLAGYFAGAGTLDGLEGAGVTIEPRLRAVFTLLASGVSLERPRHPNGKRYAPLGCRKLVPGGTIELHCENETLGFASMTHLSTLLDRRSQLSFYTPLALADGGGLLEVYPLRFGEPSGDPLGHMERHGPESEALLARHQPAIPRVGVGDLLIFDAGRHYHRVTTVTGGQARWTLGGFLARSSDGAVYYYWN